MTRDWTRIVMKGTAQVIPAVCPNCLGPADQRLRYGYKGLEGWVTRTTFYQTFAYCPACLPQAASASRLGRWGWTGVGLGLVAAVAGAILLGDALRDPATGVCTNLNANLAIAGSAALGVTTGLLTYLAARLLKRRRHPLRPGQAVWGRAAFYTGAARWGLHRDTAVYLAARPEWIAALARANPEQLDGPAYQQATGEAQPAPIAGARPFGPA
ncbi:MAG TPA: hypothetical protein VF804_04250 [Holophagaceae bacterium]